MITKPELVKHLKEVHELSARRGNATKNSAQRRTEKTALAITALKKGDRSTLVRIFQVVCREGIFDGVSAVVPHPLKVELGAFIRSRRYLPGAEVDKYLKWRLQRRLLRVKQKQNGDPACKTESPQMPEQSR